MTSQYHPIIGWTYVPNIRARFANETGGYYIKTNSQGFRSDREFRKPKGEKPRILFFGDSMTAGDLCNNHQRFAERVAQHLDAEVYNYGLANSGTDQQLLILEHLARDVAADLIVFCIYVENIERIKSGFRRSLDRNTGRYVMAPKPYFTLEKGMLQQRHVPVPVERQTFNEQNRTDKEEHIWRKIYRVYSQHDASQKIRNLLPSSIRARVADGIQRVTRYQPFLDYTDPESPGWLLMHALLKRFAAAASPTPVLIVPLPTRDFYLDGFEPVYQPLFEQLDDPAEGVYVADVTTALCRLPDGVLSRLSFRHDAHFSPFGHQQVAHILSQEIQKRELLPKTPKQTPLATPPTWDRGSEATYVLGISCFYHNAAAALIKEGEIVAAAEEERFTRIKHDRNFPHHAVNYCLEEAGIQPKDLKAVVFYDRAALTFERLLHALFAAGEPGKNLWLATMPSWVRYKINPVEVIRRHLHYDGLVLQDYHHRSHAASAFYPSPFERAAILTMDGVGEWATATIGKGGPDGVALIREMRFPHSLGLLYSAFTQFLGFKVNNGEYKMMGLAPYGEPRYVDAILEHLVDLKEDGSVELNLEYFAFLSEARMTNEAFAALFGGPARQPEARITQREMDLACSIQVVTEEAVLRMARHAHTLTGEKNLCLAGGVALNCVANGRLLREGPFEKIWIQPAAGDSGCALGAALDAYHTYFARPRRRRADARSGQGGSYLGPAYTEQEIRAFLDTHSYPYAGLEPEARAETIARLLEEGKVVGHFSGRMEYGPRALGSRSILGDPRNREMQTNLNLKIKYRESFRPFAPSVLAERVQDYFELDRESPYMLLVAPVREERRVPFERGGEQNLLVVVRKPRSDIPAVTHVDYSARIQTVSKGDHPTYYDVLQAFERRTGCGVIVNTSFNVRGEPIVCTPYDAYRCFMRTEMDVLVLEKVLLLKEEQPPWPEEKGPIEKYDPKAIDADLEDSFIKALSDFFDEEFVPLAEALKQQDAIAVNTVFQKTTSTWTGFTADQSPAAIFEFPKAMIGRVVDAKNLADTLVQTGTNGSVNRLIVPMLSKLLALKAAWIPADDEAFEEHVSDMVYVMY